MKLLNDTIAVCNLLENDDSKVNSRDAMRCTADGYDTAYLNRQQLCYSSGVAMIPMSPGAEGEP